MNPVFYYAYLVARQINRFEDENLVKNQKTNSSWWDLVKPQSPQPGVKGVNMLKFRDLENEMFMHYNAEGGGGANPNPSDDKDKDKEQNPNPNPAPSDEKITLTKAELEEKLKQKYAEGARKASEGKITPNLQEGANPPQAQNPPAVDKLAELEKEVSQLRGEKLALNAGIDATFCEDAIALLRGKGLEINDANVKQIAEKHPEWKKQTNPANGGEGGTLPLGGVGGKQNPPTPEEKTQARKLFGLN